MNMENKLNVKLNIVELLRDCPKGMKLYSPIFGNVYLDEIRPSLAVVVRTSDKQKEEFLYDGRFGINGECMLFPSKENRDWSTFQRPFKDGDVVFYDDNIAIFKEWGDETLFRTYVTKYLCCDSLIDKNVPLFGKYIRKNTRLATEEEKQKLFDAIKANGYKWNPETKTLEKLIEPKFKVGDRVRLKLKSNYIYTIHSLVWDDNKKLAYRLLPDNDKHLILVRLNTQDDYELVPNKFDITTLKPFESKVLVRSSNDDMWKPAIWGIYNDIYCSAYPYITTYGAVCQCIPYEGNQHLLGTTNNCDEYYKTWK